MNNSPSVLIIDDSKSVRTFMRSLLEVLDYQVLDAAHGKEGLEVYDRERPDIVLTDLDMPVMDGLTFIYEMNRKYINVPVIVISGKGTLTEGIEAVRRGAWDYLIKPVNINMLEATIRRSLERVRLQAENLCYREHLEELVQAQTLELQQERERYQRLLESVTSYVYSVTIREGQPFSTVHGNGCEAVTGFSPEDYATDPDLWFRMIHDEDRSAVLEAAWRIIYETLPLTVRHRIYHKNGDIRWVRNTLVPHRDAHGNLLYYDGVILDITEREHLEEQLRHAQKMEAIGQLAGGIAHDFNNILTIILGYGSAVQMNLSEEDPLRESIDEVLAAAERAANLTSSLLVFSRKQVFTPQAVDLSNIARNIEKILRRIIGEDVQLKSGYASNRLTVFADSGQLEQVLMNLAANARDAMPKGGVLTIQTQLFEPDEGLFKTYGYGESGPYALLTVSDNGNGIGEEAQKRIFDPFFTTKEAGKGTGLGLSVVYGIVQQHQGFIKVWSEPGVGSTFMIYFPLFSGELHVDTDKFSSIAVGGTETILVAEDDPDIRRMAESNLRGLGYEVLLAKDGMDALEKYRANGERTSLVVLDMLMPRKSGREVYEEIKIMRPDARVLFMSGYSPDLLQSKGLCESDAELLMKPFRPFDLACKVREALDK